MRYRHFLIPLSCVLLAACGTNESSETADDSDAASSVDTPAPFAHFNAADVAAAEALRDSTMAGSIAWDILESLTTEVGPRLAGSAAEARARVWAEAKFAEYGFQNIHTEMFDLPGWERVSASARVTSPYPQNMAITSLGGSVSTPAGGIEAEIAHFADLDALIAAPEGAAAGKIVFISYRMERTRDGSGYGPARQARSNGPSEAAKKGALALIIRSIGTDDHRNPHTGATRYAEDAPRIAATAISNPDADLLENMLRRGAPVTVHLDVQNRDPGTVRSGNVIGEIIGSERPEEIIVIGGHLDSWDLGTGAIDDGAGVAITMAAAKAIMDGSVAPKRTIRVVLFGSEETGLWGGRAYAAAHAEELANHVMAAESDFGSGRIYELKPGIATDGLPVMAEIQRVLEPLGIALADNTGGGGPDIGAMRAGGVPVASLSQDGTLYFDLHHTPDDTLDKVSAGDLDQNAAAYAAFVFMVAQYEGRFGPRPEADEDD